MNDSPPPDPVTTSRKLNRIMMIDDEAFDLKMYSRIVSRSGMVTETVTFTRAEDGLAYLLDPDSPPVDLILLDINMPRMTGFDFMEAACDELGPDFDVPIVMMLTTSMSEDDRDRAATYSPIRAYFNKPLTTDHLSLAADIVSDIATKPSADHRVAAAP